MADTTPASIEPLSEDQLEIGRIMQNLKQDLCGCISVGPDGVLRSLTADREVIDAIGLPTRLIKALLDRTPFDQDQEDRLRGADGTNVSREEMYHPDKGKVPPPLTAEQKEECRRSIEKNKDKIAEIQEKKRKGEWKPCGPVVRSNYNLGPKE